MADEERPVDGVEDEAESGTEAKATTPEPGAPADETLEGSHGADTLAGDDSLPGADAPATENTDIHSPGEASLLDEAGAQPGDDALRDDTTRDPDDGSTMDADAPIEGTVPADPEPAAEPRPETAIAPQVVEKTVVEKRGGFVPLLLGGVIAAALGYGAAAWQGGAWPFGAEANPFEDETRAALSQQTDRIDALAAEVQTATDTANGIKLTALEAAVDDLQAQIDTATGTFDGLSARLDEYDARLDEIATRPLEQISPDAVAAFERELETLRDAAAQQATEVEKMTQQALDAEANAEQLAATSKARAALADVRSALSGGEPYAEPLQTIEANGVAAPEALAAPAADGVPTLAALTEDYPPLAREALIIARRGETEESSGGARFTTFLENQLGVRSVTPREGDDADAILSRAEAALRGGALNDALAELDGLSEEARAPLSVRMARARTRADAIAAAHGLAQELNKE